MNAKQFGNIILIDLDMPQGYRLAGKDDIGKPCLYWRDTVWKEANVNGDAIEIVPIVPPSRNYDLNKNINVTTPEFEQLLNELCDTFDVNFTTETFE